MLSAVEREQRIVEHMPLVDRVASRMRSYFGGRLSYQDLQSAGYVGLIHATDHYVPETGVPFAAYAHRRIRGEMLDEARRADWLTRGQRHNLHSDPSLAANAHAPISADLVAETAPSKTPSPLDKCIVSQEQARVRNAICTLKPRHQQAVIAYYWQERMMSEISRDLGINESRVSQMMTASKRKLRDALTVDPIWDTPSQPGDRSTRSTSASRTRNTARG